MSAFIARVAAEFLVLVLGAADVACAESSGRHDDGAAVLQVVANRARSGLARYDGTLIDALFEPGQHAHGCRWPITVEHLRLGVDFVRGELDAPPWARKALWYCGRWDRPGLCESRGAVPLGAVVHTFYGRPGRREGASR